MAQVSIDSTVSTGVYQYLDSGSFLSDYIMEEGNWIINAAGYPGELSVTPVNSLISHAGFGEIFLSSFTAPNGFESNLVIP